jgi:hypothetical protein
MISNILGFLSKGKSTLIGVGTVVFALMSMFTLCELKDKKITKLEKENSHSKTVLSDLRKEIALNREICERSKEFRDFKQEAKEEVQEMIQQEHNSSYVILTTKRGKSDE